MIYISSASIRADRIGDAVRILAESGFQYIELSGGTAFYPEWKEDLLKLKKEYDLHFLLHNYFPPPRDSFILNLASLNDDIFNKSLEHYKTAIELSRDLGGDRFGLHAGFYYDPAFGEIGKTLSFKEVYPKNEIDARFCEGFKELRDVSCGLLLYVENHVLSLNNYTVFKPAVPVMLTCFSDYSDLQELVSFPILLDLAHLYVSSQTLGLDYEQEVSQLLVKTDYLHISSNNGHADSNEPINSNSPILKPLLGIDLENYIITLEVYGTLKEIKQSNDVMQSIITSLEL